jgi:hypothetical protein
LAVEVVENSAAEISGFVGRAIVSEGVGGRWLRQGTRNATDAKNFKERVGQEWVNLPWVTSNDWPVLLSK